MPTVSKTIRTEKNVWTFDVSMPKDGVVKIMRIYGDVTNKQNLDEAIEALKEELQRPSKRKSKER